MAKSVPVNKSQAIREALTANPTMTPSEIAAQLNKTHGIKISPQYVSTIKSNAKLVGRKPPVAIRQFPRKAGPSRTNGADYSGALTAGVDFIQAAGGIDKAKEVLATVEKIKSVVSFL